MAIELTDAILLWDGDVLNIVVFDPETRDWRIETWELVSNLQADNMSGDFR